MTGVGQVAFHDKANGSLVERRRRGGRLVADRPGLHRARVLPPPRRRRPATGYDGARPARRLEPRARPTRTCLGRGRGAGRRPTGSENGLADDAPVPGRRRHRLGVGPRPAHLASPTPSSRPPRVAEARGLTVDEVLALVDEHTDEPLARRSSASPGVNVLRSSTWPARRAAGCRRDPHGRRSADRRRGGQLRIYLGRRARRGQDLRHARRGLAPRASAAPTSSSASSRPTAGRSTAAQLRRPRGRAPATTSTTGARRSRRWTSTPSWPGAPQVALVDELAHTNVPGLAQREAVAGRRGAARRRHRRDLHGQHPAPRVAQRRGRADHRRPAAETVPDAVVRRRRPDRAGRHDPRGAAAAHGPRQHLPGRARSTPRSATTSGPATSPRCASSPCCGWPTGSTRRSRTTATAHGIADAVGDPGAGRGRASPARRAASTLIRRAARIAEPRAGRARRRARRAGRRAGRAPRPRARPSTAGCSRSSAAPTARSSATTSPRRSSAFAAAERATQLVLGASRRSRWHELDAAARSSTGCCAWPRGPRRPRDLRTEADDGGGEPPPPHPRPAPPLAARRRRLAGLGRSLVVGLPAAHARRCRLRRRPRPHRPSCCSAPRWWSWRRGRSAGCCPAWSAAVAGVRAAQLVLHAAAPHLHRSRSRERWSRSLVFVVVGVGRQPAGRPRWPGGPPRRTRARGRGRGARPAAAGSWSPSADPLPELLDAACARTVRPRRRRGAAARRRRDWHVERRAGSRPPPSPADGDPPRP